VAMKTFRISSNDRWAAEDVTYADNQIILVFEWGGTYHNFTAEYTPVVACQHTNVETLNAVEATCTASGLSEGKKCLDCGEVLTKQETIPAKGHTETTLEGKDATCTEAGLTEGKKCSLCGTILLKQEEISSLGHKDKNGDYECDVCHAELCTNHIPAEPIVENKKDSSCSETGSYDSVIKCSVCGDELERETKTIEKLPHTEEEIAGKAATCTETGLTAGKKCSVCGEILEAQQEIGKLPHTEEKIAGKDATCTETGLTEGKKCSVCGEILEAQQEIGKLPHTEQTLSAKAPSCVATGLTEGKKCSVCGEILTEQETIPAEGHKWNGGETLLDVTTYECEVCGVQKVESAKLENEDNASFESDEEIDDYVSKEDAKPIFEDMKNTLKNLSMRAGISFVCLLVLIIASFVCGNNKGEGASIAYLIIIVCSSVFLLRF